MKTLKEGHEDRWWHGAIMTCPICGRMEQLEPGDDMTVTLTVYVSSVSLMCAKCGCVHSINKEARHD